MRKLLVFGGSGFIGGNIVSHAKQNGWDVLATGKKHVNEDSGIHIREVDITDRKAVHAIIEEFSPDAVVNACAIANIDKAETERDLAWSVNVLGARNIAESCAKYSIRHIFFSSDAVFSGEEDFYSEEDVPQPVNYYGKTKAAAEKEILSVFPEAVVIRISFVMGFHKTGGVSYLIWLKNKLKEGGEIISPKEEIRTPIDVMTLSDVVLEIAENQIRGFIHIGSTDSINRYDLTKKLIHFLGDGSCHAKILDTWQSSTERVPRHKNGVLCIKKAQKVLKTQMLTIDEGIARLFGVKGRSNNTL